MSDIRKYAMREDTASHTRGGERWHLLPELMQVGLFLGDVDAVREGATRRVAFQTLPNRVLWGVHLGGRQGHTDRHVTQATVWCHGSKVKVSSYIEQYTILRTAQSTIHFTLWQTCSIEHYLSFSWKHLATDYLYTNIHYCLKPCTYSYSWVIWSNPRFDTAAQHLSPGSLSRESDALTTAPQCNMARFYKYIYLPRHDEKLFYLQMTSPPAKTFIQGIEFRFIGVNCAVRWHACLLLCTCACHHHKL